MAERTRRVRGIVALAAAAGLGSCGNPLATTDEDRGFRLDPKVLRRLEPMPLERYASAQTESGKGGGAKTAVEESRPASRLAGLENVDLTLEQCRASALANNLDLKVALVDPAIATEGLRAEEAKFEAVFRPSLRVVNQDNPTLDVTSFNQQEFLQASGEVSLPLRTGGRVGVDLTESRQETPNPFATLNTAYNADSNFSIAQPLLRNAGREVNTHSIRVAAYQEQIAETRAKVQVIAQLASVDRAYWLLYATKRELEVRQSQYELAVEQLQKARRRFDAGAVAEIEVVRATSGVAERLEGIILAENAVLRAQRGLKRIVNMPGLDVDTRSLVTPTSVPAPVRYELDGAALASGALGARMELLEVELQLLADASQIDFSKNQLLPLLDLDASYRIGGLGRTLADSNGELWKNRFETWSVGVTGEVPLGNEAAKARLQQAVLTRVQRASTKQLREQTIRQEVLDACDRVEAGWQRIMAARQAAILAGRTLEGEQRQYDAGARTSTDVLDAASRLAEAQSNEIRALADYQISLVDLAVATGTTLGAGRVEWAPITEETPIAAPIEPTAPDAPPLPPPATEPPGEAMQEVGEGAAAKDAIQGG